MFFLYFCVAIIDIMHVTIADINNIITCLEIFNQYKKKVVFESATWWRIVLPQSVNVPAGKR